MKFSSQINNNLKVKSSEKRNFWKSLFECYKKSSDDNLNDVTVYEGQGPGEKETIVQRSLQRKAEVDGGEDVNQMKIVDVIANPAMFTSPFVNENLLNESPRVLIMKNRSLESNDDIEVLQGILDRNRLVSVKKVPKSFHHFAEKEIRLLSKQETHENIVRFLFSIIKNEDHFLVTDRYEVNLRSIMIFPHILKTKEILMQLINVTDFLHKQNILYMNFNPDNVHLVSLTNGRKLGTKVILANFNHAIELTRNGEIAQVRNDFKGVTNFVAPETKKNKTANISTDIFTLGCLFYYILTKGDELPQVGDPKNVTAFNGIFKKLEAKTKTSDEILCIHLIMRMTNISKKRPAIAKIKKHPLFWETHEFFDLILRVKKRLESNEDKAFKEKLECNKEKVFGANWEDKLEPSVYNEITKRKNYDGTSMSDLVTVIRNHYAHKCSPTLKGIMGTMEKSKEYWTAKYPRLILHLCQVIECFV